jgi:hypothetical protein
VEEVIETHHHLASFLLEEESAVEEAGLVET